MSIRLSAFGHLPSTNLSRSGVPLISTGSSASGRSIVHPVAFGGDSRTSTSSVVLASSRSISTSTTIGVRATTGAVAELAAQAALNLAPVPGFRAFFREVTLVVAVAAGDVVLLVVSIGLEICGEEKAYHVGLLRAVTSSVTSNVAVAADHDAFVGAVGGSVALLLTVSALLGRLCAPVSNDQTMT